MSRTRRFLHGVGAGYLQQALTLIGGLWLTRFLLAQLGPSDYGTWLVALQWLAYLDLIDLGVVAILPREVAYATGGAAGSDHPYAAAIRVIRRAGRIALLQVPLVAAAGAVLWWWLYAHADMDAGMVGLILIVYVAQFPLRIFPAALQGLQDLAFLSWARVGLWLAQATAMVVGIYAGLGASALIVGWAVYQGLMPLACWVRLRRVYGAADDASAESPQQPARLLTRGFWVSITRVAQLLLNGTEILLLQAVLGPAAVVVYVCSARLVTILSTQTYAIVLTAEPALSELRAAGHAERLTQVSVALRDVMLLLSGLMACVILATNAGFVAWWVGAERYAGDTLTFWLLGTMVVRHFTFTLGHLLFCCGYERALAVVGLLDGALTVGSGWLLIPSLGLLGPSVGSFLGVALVTLPITLVLLARDARVSLLTILGDHWPWLWRFAALACALAVLGQYWQPHGFAELVATGLVVCTAYAAVMLPIVWRSAVGTFLRQRWLGWTTRSQVPFREEACGDDSPAHQATAPEAHATGRAGAGAPLGAVGGVQPGR